MFRADSGMGPYTYSGSGIPTWLKLTSDGTLAGRVEAGSSSFTVTVTDATGAMARQEYRLDVREKPSLFWRILNWVGKWIGYLAIVVYVFFVLVGFPGTRRTRGVIPWVRDKLQERR